MHPNKSKCIKARNAYIHSLKNLKLVPHDRELKLLNKKDYWKAKSKGPYKWSIDKIHGIEWIGFVGYEIHFNGYVRVRKSSIKKEMRKQFETIRKVKSAIVNDNIRKSTGTVEESVIKKLIGMSVGRFNLRNFKSAKNEMCWINGFTQINDNKYSRIQLKTLDRCRNKLFRKFKKELVNVKIDTIDPKGSNKKREKVYYGKPFSYYYQGIIKPHLLK